MGRPAYWHPRHRGIAWRHWAMRTACARGALGAALSRRDPRRGRAVFPRPEAPRATIAAMVERVLLASPRGYCAGVERAVETVELALDHYGPPVYVRKQIVHNIHVVRDLEARGAIFVDSGSGGPGGRDDRLLGARGRTLGECRLRRARSQRHRRHLPTRDEGARAGAALCRGRLHGRPDRACRSRGGRRHDGRGPGGHRARPGRGRGGGARPAEPAPRLAYITQTTLSVDETSKR